LQELPECCRGGWLRRNFHFQDLAEQTRQEIAEKYLANLSLSIAEVSYLLGYSEPSALHRAFKRWKGMTPQEFRGASKH